MALQYETGSLEGDLAKAQQLTTQQQTAGTYSTPAATTAPAPVMTTGSPELAPAFNIGQINTQPSSTIPATSIADSVTSGDVNSLLKQNQELFQQQLKAIDFTPEYLDLKKQFSDTNNKLTGLTNETFQRSADLRGQGGEVGQPLVGRQLNALEREIAYRQLPLSQQLQAITGQLSVLQEERNNTLAKLQLMADQGRYDIGLAMEFNNIMRQEQKEARALAREYGITSQFYNEGGTIYRTSDGKPYSSAEQFFKDAGVQSFDQAKQTGILTDLGESIAMKFQREQFERSVFESDRNFGRGVFESDRGFNRGVLESDRAYKLQSTSLIENPDGSKSIVNLLDGSTRKVSGDDYWSLYNGITGYGSPLWENGVDADLKIGDPVFSPTSGEVIATSDNFVGPVKGGGFGNMVKIRTDSGEEVWLSHLSDTTVQVGQRVNAGDVVGIGGNTGDVIPGKGGDGSHLDFTVKTADGKFMSAQQAHLWANNAYKNGTESAIALDNDQRQVLKTAGLSDQTINTVLRDISQGGIDAALQDSGLPQSQVNAFYEALRGGSPVQSNITRELVASKLGVDDDDKRSGLFGWWGETNQAKIDAVMDVIQQYSILGWTDKQILEGFEDIKKEAK